MNAYVFDIDGVITDLISKKVEASLLPKLAKILNRGDILAFNTGRSFSSVNERVLTPFLEIVENNSLLKNVFIVCEMGNVIVTHKNGAWNKKVLDDPLPTSLQETIKALVAKEFSESMFFDETKETMLSIEMKDGYNVMAFTKQEDILKEKISALILEDKYLPLGLDLRTNLIAIDILYEDAGKGLGAERFQDWMIENALIPEAVFMFGDNASDLEMARKLGDSYEVIFVFVNDHIKLDTSFVSCKVVYTKNQFDHGTLEYLKSITK